MSNFIYISPKDIIHQIRLSCQLPALIEAIAVRQIITKTAEALAIPIEPDELQQAADRFRLEKNLLGADMTLSWLQTHDLSVDQFEELIYDTVLSAKVAHLLFASKVEPFFAEHQLDYVQAVIYEVTLDDRDLAMELFYAIQEDEISFWQVARQYIQEPELRHRLGYRGTVCRKDLPPELAAAVFAARPPELLKPITISQNVHLVWVEALLQPQLDQELKSQILSDLFSDWIQQQIQQVEIKANLGDI